MHNSHLRDRWQPARKLVALQKGAQQGGEFSCSILRREDLQGRDWDEESVSGGGQADNQEVNGWKLLKSSLLDKTKLLVESNAYALVITS